MWSDHGKVMVDPGLFAIQYRFFIVKGRSYLAGHSCGSLAEVGIRNSDAVSVIRSQSRLAKWQTGVCIPEYNILTVEIWAADATARIMPDVGES
jgi:hypothetical protein